jgi:hypothetical protein
MMVVSEKYLKGFLQLNKQIMEQNKLAEGYHSNLAVWLYLESLKIL